MPSAVSRIASEGYKREQHGVGIEFEREGVGIRVECGHNENEKMIEIRGRSAQHDEYVHGCGLRLEDFACVTMMATSRGQRGIFSIMSKEIMGYQADEEEQRRHTARIDVTIPIFPWYTKGNAAAYCPVGLTTWH